jgi:hypothetical protein
MQCTYEYDDPMAARHMYPETEEFPTLQLLADSFVRALGHQTTDGPKLLGTSEQARALDPLVRYCAALIGRTRLKIVSHGARSELLRHMEQALHTSLRPEGVHGMLPLLCACAYWKALEARVYLTGLTLQPALDSLCGYTLVANERFTDSTLGMWLPFLPPALDYLLEAHQVGADGSIQISIPDLLCADHIHLMQRMEQHNPKIDAFHRREGLVAFDFTREGA